VRRPALRYPRHRHAVTGHDATPAPGCEGDGRRTPKLSCGVAPAEGATLAQRFAGALPSLRIPRQLQRHVSPARGGPTPARRAGSAGAPATPGSGRGSAAPGRPRRTPKLAAQRERVDPHTSSAGRPGTASETRYAAVSRRAVPTPSTHHCCCETATARTRRASPGAQYGTVGRRGGEHAERVPATPHAWAGGQPAGARTTRGWSAAQGYRPASESSSAVLRWLRPPEAGAHAVLGSASTARSQRARRIGGQGSVCAG
jgi:hypothetical protein